MEAKRVFGYTDIHWSDRDERALSVAMKAQAVFKPDITVIGGDLLNSSVFSRHPKVKLDADAEYDYVDGELDPANKFLDYVQEHTNKRTVMLEGNHDAWFERWIRNTEGGLGLRSLLPKTFLSKGRKDFTWVDHAVPSDTRECSYQLKAGLIVTHGWCAPKYAAQHHLDKARDTSVIYHHTHRTDMRRAKLYRGGYIKAMCGGCLCKRTPMYAHNGSPTDWTHGFWIAFLGKAPNDFTMYAIDITENYTAVLDGGMQINA